MCDKKAKTVKTQLSSIRKYPPFWEKAIPVLITFSTLAALSLIIIAIVVIITKNSI